MAVDKKSFEDIIKDSPVPVLVDFYATWCGPCQAMAPALEQVANDLHGEAKILKVDIDRNPNAAAHFRVQSVPTLIIFKNGEQVWRGSGAMPAFQLKQLLAQYK